MGPSYTSHLLMALALGAGVSGCSKDRGTPGAEKNAQLGKAAATVSRPEADHQQLIEVSIRVDKRGNAAGIEATSGNPALYGPAIEAARQWKNPRRCNDDGSPIRYESKLLVFFDRSDHLVEVRPPILVGISPVSAKLLQRVEPDYPTDLKQKGIGGTVILQIRIDQKGNVVEAKALKGPSPLYPSAVNAALKWKYKPTYFLDCSPIPVVATVTMIFNPSRAQADNSASQR